jgi:hypothetical protein
MQHFNQCKTLLGQDQTAASGRHIAANIAANACALWLGLYVGACGLDLLLLF